eukprot:8725978-Pyramimonas_sp.AAC.1
MQGIAAKLAAGLIDKKKAEEEKRIFKPLKANAAKKRPAAAKRAAPSVQPEEADGPGAPNPIESENEDGDNDGEEDE